LANFQGGKVILGVEDDGKISGIHRDNLEEWVMNIFQDKIHPLILPFYEEMKVDDKTVAVISFPQGISKPYVVREKKQRRFIFVSVQHPERQPASNKHVALGCMLHTEAMPVPRTDIGCLDEARLQNYLKDIIKDPEVPQTPAEWEARLLSLDFLTKVEDKIYCSIAGLVLFGKNPRHYLKQSGLRIFAFASEDKTYQALLDDILDGPLVGRFDTNAPKSLIDGGIIERFIGQITPFISKEASHIDEHFRRKTEWFYPIEAIRELVVNALAHRDWTRSVEIEVGIYANRFEIISPGALQNSMTIEKMLAGQRSPRNILIMEVLRDYGYVDYRGMGIRTKVIPLMRRINHAEPIFEATEDHVKTVLPKSIR
jgi:ATP-dependent DNA helicase RecG